MHRTTCALLHFVQHAKLKAPTLPSRHELFNFAAASQVGNRRRRCWPCVCLLPMTLQLLAPAQMATAVDAAAAAAGPKGNRRGSCCRCCRLREQRLTPPHAAGSDGNVSAARRRLREQRLRRSRGCGADGHRPSLHGRHINTDAFEDRPKGQDKASAETAPTSTCKVVV